MFDWIHRFTLDTSVFIDSALQFLYYYVLLNKNACGDFIDEKAIEVYPLVLRGNDGVLLFYTYMGRL